MGKTIKLIKIVSFIIIALEVLAGVVFSIFYFNNFFDFYAAVKPEYLAITMIIVVVVNCLFVWIIILILATLRQKTDLIWISLLGNQS